MPTRNVTLTEELDRFVAEKVEAGLYADASEVMRAALRNLAREEREFEARLAALRLDIQEGLDSGVADFDPFKRAQEHIRVLANES